MKQLEKFSMGIGDRFAHQGKAQLQAMIKARDLGLCIAPVWNKSHREHTIIHTEPSSVLQEAQSAVASLNWNGPWHVDADHIHLQNVDLFMESCDFFTLDVADFTGMSAATFDIEAFADSCQGFCGSLTIPGIAQPFEITRRRIMEIADKYLLAIQEAGKLYQKIEMVKGAGNFITEISMDESDRPQTPEELFFILAAIGQEKIPVQTIAPKFTGRFNKGVDYLGDVSRFAEEFEADLAVIALAAKTFGLPANLKLSIHSGSDKFSIYGVIREAIRKTGAGLHLKTAGTTWLEELIGLAEAGDEGLTIAKDVYQEALSRFDELCVPYATVIDIVRHNLPSPETVADWTGLQYARALRHDQTCQDFNPDFRQLLHVGYKVAAEMGERYLDALKKFEPMIARNVTENLFDRHIKRIFI